MSEVSKDALDDIVASILMENKAFKNSVVRKLYKIMKPLFSTNSNDYTKTNIYSCTLFNEESQNALDKIIAAILMEIPRFKACKKV